MDRKKQIIELLKYREKLQRMNDKNFENQESSKNTNQKEEGFVLVKTNKAVVDNEDFNEELINNNDGSILKKDRTRIINKIGNIVGLAFLTLFLESIFILISLYIYQ